MVVVAVQVTVFMTLTDPPRPCGGIGMIGEWMLRCVMMGREKHDLCAPVNGFGCNEGIGKSALTLEVIRGMATIIVTSPVGASRAIYRRLLKSSGQERPNQ